ncbi:YlbF family regulator [Caldibacillus debilis]|uniref:YlbF family regulator n=1 Tax=Caldibacillus debilis TaxID=301148 RepID=UPI0003826B0F|nr:YlbF family regulator [Caldibacillus debilis]
MPEDMYEVASQLGKAIRESEEFAALKEKYDELLKDNIARKIFDDFRVLQMRLQEKQMMGQPASDTELMDAQKLALQVQQNEKILSLIEAEQRMGTVMNEINEIFMKPLAELYKILE